ncbi:MAG: stage II sporulation protein R [Clostridia bacterium]|nr:stage II sporulation protein R [Clostridia bacterium]
MSIIISLTALGFSGILTEKDGGRYEMNSTNTNSTHTCGEYLRIHIRADSNDPNAQAVKYRVRDKVVEYLTPLVAEYTTKSAAIDGVGAHLQDVSAVASEVLKAQGFAYSATAELTTESFPTRVYEDCTLPAGEYSALIIRLGSGQGDNWWCVVYPPLCFAGTGEDVVYKSKILEIIDDFKKRK